MGELSLEYKVNGSQILSEHSNWSGCNRIFIYDETGSPIGFKFHESAYADGVYEYYYYVKNLQGDVTKLYGADGTLYATYKYDAWGNHTVTYSNGGASIAAVNTNPIRYRGYYYDTESNLYYLNSRYYSPVLRRFVSADSYISTGHGFVGNNMYAYCNNNPVMYVDYEGEFPWIIIAILAAGAIGGGIWGFTSDERFVDVIDEKNNNILYDENSDGLETRQSDELTVGDRITNTIIGSAIGIMASGAIIATCGVITVALGGTSAAFLGVTGLQAFCIGALSLDAMAFFVLPIFGMQADGIEFESMDTPSTPIVP